MKIRAIAPLIAIAAIVAVTAAGNPALNADSGMPEEVRQALHEERETLAIGVTPGRGRIYAFDYDSRSALNAGLARSRYLDLAGTGCFPDPENASWAPLYGSFNWRALPVSYRIDTSGAPSYLDPEELRAAIRRALDTWDAEEIPVGQLFNEVSPDSPADVVVRWQNLGFPSALGFTATSMDFTIQEPLSAEIVLNSDVDRRGDEWTDLWGLLPFDCGWNPPPDFPNFDFVRDVQSVVTHEVGHVLNLAHVYSLEKDIGQTMFWLNVSHETFKQSLGHGDRKGLKSLYSQAGR